MGICACLCQICSCSMRAQGIIIAMFRRFSANFAVLSIFLDCFLVAGALCLAVVLREPFNGLPFVIDIPQPSLPWEIYAVFPLLWVAILLLFSVYDGRKNLRVVDEFNGLTLGSLLAAITLAAVATMRALLR